MGKRSPCSIDTLTRENQQKEDGREGRSPFSMEKTRASFVRAMLPNFSGRLSFPQAFLKNLTEERLDKAVLVSPIGQWEVKVHGDLNTGLWFGGEGWAEFVTDHEVFIGDFMVFEHRGGMVFNVIVLDNTACSKSYSPSCAGPRKDQGSTANIISEQKKKNKNNRSETHDGVVPSRPTFTATIFAYNLTRNLVAIPAQFKREAGIGRKSSMKIKDPKGRSWPVNICHGRSRDVIGKGWLDFAKANKLKIGDTCTFELVACDLMEVHVSKQYCRK